MIRLALVGFGAWGRNYLRAARDSGEAEVTQVVLREGSKSRAAAEATGLQVVSCVAEVDADAAIIATHPTVAPWIARVLVEVCGLPVMIEKPAALSVQDAEAIRQCEAESGLPVLIGHQHLFATGYEHLRYIAEPAGALAEFTGPVTRDYSAQWDYGAHAAACLIGLGCKDYTMVAGEGKRAARVEAWANGGRVIYDGYAAQEPPLTRQVRAFARVINGSMPDWRFGAKWAIDVAKLLSGRLDHAAPQR